MGKLDSAVVSPSHEHDQRDYNQTEEQRELSTLNVYLFLGFLVKACLRASGKRVCFIESVVLY